VFCFASDTLTALLLKQLRGTFRDVSARLENLFVAIGSDELRNKMVSHTTDQKGVLLIETFRFYGRYCIAVEGQCRGECSVVVAPPRDELSARLLNILKKQEVCVINV
jgi:hypothetical protein